MNSLLKHCGCPNCANRCEVCRSIRDGTASIEIVSQAESLIPNEFRYAPRPIGYSQDMRWWETDNGPIGYD
mgnify:CR=1 FL=1